jgi:hypothetical protein
MPPGNPEAASARLREELGGPLPDGVSRLDAASLEHLADAIVAARRRQAAEIAAAGERSLGFVPRLLRAPLRKVLG